MKTIRQVMSLVLVLAMAHFGLGFTAQAQVRGFNRGYYGGPNSLLTGTFRLDLSRSDNPTDAVRNATWNLPPDVRDRVSNRLMNRLEAPEELAIQRRGSQIVMASSLAPEASFIADGREQVEQMDNGRSVRTSARIYGQRLTVNTASSGARGDNDFTITIEPLDAGNRLRVTRTIYSERMAQPIVVRSLYNRVSDVAQFDTFRNRPRALARANWRSDDVAIRDGEVLEARMDSNLSTRYTRQGERFSMTVVSPEQYRGAVIEGTVADLDRSGRIRGRAAMNFDFNSIRMPNGETHAFSGVIEGIRTPNGESVQVDNEGVVRDHSQGNKALERTAIGSAVGAIVGAIAGGGKGAAIGAAVGAGAGAGSVYVQGRDDLELSPGTIVNIRSLN